MLDCASAPVPGVPGYTRYRLAILTISLPQYHTFFLSVNFPSRRDFLFRLPVQLPYLT